MRIYFSIFLLCGLLEPAQGGLVAWWQFDDNLQDSSGREHHGTLTGHGSWVEGFDGREHGALRLDQDQLGEDPPTVTHIAIDTNSGLDGIPASTNGDFTVAVWVKAHSQNNRLIYSETSDTSNAMFMLGTGVGGQTQKARIFIRTHNDGPDFSMVSHQEAFNGSWNHIAVRRTGGNIRLFINGAAQSLRDFPPGPRDQLNLVTIGTSVHAEGPLPEASFVGDIDGLRVYDHALSNESILRMSERLEPGSDGGSFRIVPLEPAAVLEEPDGGCFGANPETWSGTTTYTLEAPAGVARLPIEIGVVLTYRDRGHPRGGIEGWQLSVETSSSFHVTHATTLGTVGDLRTRPPGRRATISQETTEHSNLPEWDDWLGREGATSRVYLALEERITLEAGEHLVLRIHGEVDVESDEPIWARISEGLQGSGQPVVTSLVRGAAVARAGSCHAMIRVRQAENPEGVFRRGDSNSNGTIDIADGIFTLSHLFASGSAPLCPDAADANDDGEIDISDGITLLQHLFADGTSLPEPFLTCGSDSTGDTLDCPVFPPCQK